MKKALIRLSLSTAILLGVSAALLYFTRSRPVILSFSPDPTMVRPRNYCLLNPFRDKSPEIVAEKYLKGLRDGDVESIRPFLPAHYAQENAHRIPDNEQKWPIRSWRIGERVDRPGATELMFWVQRGGGYSKDGDEEEVRLWIKRSGSVWGLETYNAIY
jgi:hypothetical protein